MAVTTYVNWEGITAKQYDEARNVVNWENDPPPGLLFHVAAFDGTAGHFTDIWETAEAFQEFIEQRVAPGMAQVGVTSQPDPQIRPVHAVFTPGFQPK
jgi:hypothetical protein